jgi:hypothetical protein
MASVRARHWVGRLLAWVVLGTILTGCANATFKSDLSFGSRIGLRPDEPNVGVPTPTACDEYKTYTRYAMDLKEAYRTRTTQNRTWIYVAGITGLGVAAASGALAAATAVAAGTLALLAISGGFAAGTFMTIDNPELANVYNMAGNQIGTALAAAESQVLLAPEPKDCSAALATLVTAVSDARNTLETARTNSAAGALVRAQAGVRAVTEPTANPLGASLTHVTLNGEITAMNTVTSGPVPVPADGLLTLTVKNVPLESVQPKEIRVAIGSKILDMATAFPIKKPGAFEYDVKVQVPSTPPDAAKEYAPFLVLGPSKQRIPTAAGSELKLKYPGP